MGACENRIVTEGLRVRIPDETDMAEVPLGKAPNPSNAPGDQEELAAHTVLVTNKHFISLLSRRRLISVHCLMFLT